MWQLSNAEPFDCFLVESLLIRADESKLLVPERERREQRCHIFHNYIVRAAFPVV